jgi:caspase domain-containing protein
MCGASQICVLMRRSVYLLALLIVTGCAGISLPPSYIDTGRFVDDRPTRQATSVLQVDLKPFENQLQDRTKVGIKRVGVNEISGPLLPTKDVVSVLQNSVITQLGLKGITVGQATLRLEGSVHEFFVDVNVDPATGRGKFRAVVRMDLAAFDTASQRQLWHETYTGTASAAAPSVIDSAYENTLKVAFTNLLNQIRQDNSLLELRQLYQPALLASRPPPPAPPAVTPPPPSPAPVPSRSQNQTPTGAGDTTPPRIVFMSPALPPTREIMTIEHGVAIIGLVLGTSEVDKLRVQGGTMMRRMLASAQVLQAAGVKGPGVEFTAWVFLTPGVNRIEFQTVDSQGNPLQEILTIQRQVDASPPKLALLEPQLTPAVVARTNRAKQLISGFAADESGVAEIQVNGLTAQMTTASAQELQAAGLAGTGVKFTGYAELQPGSNQVEIQAIDRYQNIRPQVFTVQRQELVGEKVESKQLYTRSVGVVIGVDAYASWPHLTYAVHDAKEVQKTLKAMGFDEVIELLNRDATQARLLQLFETELPKKVGKNDRVVIFFAGHAQTQALPDGTQMGHLMPVDASGQEAFSTAISMARLRNASKQLPAKHIFYVIDACYSGLLLQRGLTAPPSLNQDTLSVARKLVAQPATQLVSAGHQGEQVIPEGGQSLFTKYLIQGLQGEADTNNDRMITVTELATYLAHQVSIASDNRQTPQYGQMEGDGEIVFVY